MAKKRKAEEAEAEEAPSTAEAAVGASSSGVIGDYTGVTRKTTHKKKKVLVMCSRGVTTTSRELVEDLLKLLPHGRKEPNFNKREPLTNVAEIAQLAGCRLCLYFEARKMKDLYLWAADVSGGPSAKFLVEQARCRAKALPSTRMATLAHLARRVLSRGTGQADGRHAAERQLLARLAPDAVVRRDLRAGASPEADA